MKVSAMVGLGFMMISPVASFATTRGVMVGSAIFPIPECGTLALLGSGLIGLAALVRRHFQS